VNFCKGKGKSRKKVFIYNVAVPLAVSPRKKTNKTGKNIMKGKEEKGFIYEVAVPPLRRIIAILNTRNCLTWRVGVVRCVFLSKKPEHNIWRVEVGL